MTWLPVLAGCAIVLTTLVDAGVTVIHPSERAPIGGRVNAASWRAVRAIALRVGSRRLLTLAGPAAIAVNVVLWVLGLWVGFALVYLPHLEDLTSQPDEAFGGGLAQALYFSGVVLTTVGFGDLVASTDALRLVTTFEPAAGLSMITAAITYVLSVYPLITEERTVALHLFDLGVHDPSVAALVALHGDQTSIEELQRGLIRGHQNVRRFPILYYFEPPDENESIVTLLRAAVTMSTVLRWGVDRARVPVAAIHGPALERTLTRLMDDYEEEYVRSKASGGATSLSSEDAAKRFERLKKAIAMADPGLPTKAPGPPDGFDRFVARAEAFLAALAEQHAVAHRPLFGE